MSYCSKISLQQQGNSDMYIIYYKDQYSLLEKAGRRQQGKTFYTVIYGRMRSHLLLPN